MLESSWVVATQKSVSQIRDDLKLATDRDDGLLVARLQGESAWTGLDGKISQWLKKQLDACAA